MYLSCYRPPRGLLLEHTSNSRCEDNETTWGLPFNMVMENGPFIGDLPIQIVIFHSYVNLYHRVKRNRLAKNQRVLMIHRRARWFFPYSSSVFWGYYQTVLALCTSCPTFAAYFSKNNSCKKHPKTLESHLFCC